MNEQVGSSPALDTALIENLKSQPDDTLRMLMKEARIILEARGDARRKQALAEIQRLARENGLSLCVKKPARKRGRPRKDGPAAP